jgi:hypothetical protein
MDKQVAVTVPHRACYIFAQGTLSATCRACGFTAKDTKRSSAATYLLAHIRAMRLESRADGPPAGAGEVAYGATPGRESGRITGALQMTMDQGGLTAEPSTVSSWPSDLAVSVSSQGANGPIRNPLTQSKVRRGKLGHRIYEG